MTLLVNGRWLTAPLSGLQRTAAQLVAGLRAEGVPVQVVAPRGRPLSGPADVLLPAPAGRGGAQAFEQLVLPAWAGRRPLLSPANLSPLLARRAGVVVHDLAPLAGPQWFAPAMRAYGRAVVAGARRASLVLTVSEAVGRELQAVGVPRARLRVVRWAVDPAFARVPQAEVAAVRARLGLDRPYALLVGWPDPRKDVLAALAASAGVQREAPHDLVLVGRRHPVFAPVAQPTGPGVRVLAGVDDEALRALLTGAAALLYPTRYEGFGLPPLEAAACGTPAVVSDLPVLRETVGDAAAAWVRPGDVRGLAAALLAALRGELAPGPPAAWTPAEAAAQTAAAVAPLLG